MILYALLSLVVYNYYYSLTKQKIQQGYYFFWQQGYYCKRYLTYKQSKYLVSAFVCPLIFPSRISFRYHAFTIKYLVFCVNIPILNSCWCRNRILLSDRKHPIVSNKIYNYIYGTMIKANILTLYLHIYIHCRINDDSNNHNCKREEVQPVHL